MGHVEAVLILIKNQENWLCYTFIIKKSTHYIYLIFFYISVCFETLLFISNLQF
jgi:hypothetical protein